MGVDGSQSTDKTQLMLKHGSAVWKGKGSTQKQGDRAEAVVRVQTRNAPLAVEVMMRVL